MFSEVFEKHSNDVFKCFLFFFFYKTAQTQTFKPVKRAAAAHGRGGKRAGNNNIILLSCGPLVKERTGKSLTADKRARHAWSSLITKVFYRCRAGCRRTIGILSRRCGRNRVWTTPPPPRRNAIANRTMPRLINDDDDDNDSDTDIIIIIMITNFLFFAFHARGTLHCFVYRIASRSVPDDDVFLLFLENSVPFRGELFLNGS